MLNGDQINHIHEALISGYNRASLEMMVKIQLDEDLDVISGGNNLSEVVFSLVRWADRTGNIENLVQGAYDFNPSNKRLQLAKQNLEIWIKDVCSQDNNNHKKNYGETDIGLNPDEWQTSKKHKSSWKKFVSFLTDDPT